MEKIQIKCPVCSQKFSVEESYMGRMVECGTCDELFEINEDTLAKKRKFYPGERSGNAAQTFAKAAPLSNSDNTNVNFQVASYNNIDAKYAQPRGTIKTIMIIAGITLILLFIALFILDSQKSGVLKNLDNTKRYVLAGFIIVIGSVLIIKGFRRRTRGLLTSLLLGSGLASMPIMFPAVASPKENSQEESTPIVENLPQQDSFSERLQNYKISIGFDKIEQLRNESSNPDQIKAILLHESKVQYLDTILPYLERVLNLNKTPVTYPYGRDIDGSPVTLLTMSSDTSFDELFELTRKFGTPLEMNDIRSAVKVIEVKVDKKTLTPPPPGTTNNPLDPNYFNVNYQELKSIDRTRQFNAAKRLESGEYLGRQSDISKLLADLITHRDHELSEQLIATLNNWTRPEYKTDEKVLNYAKVVAGTEHMSRPVMDYLVKKNVSGSASVLSKQWASKGGPLWASYLVAAKQIGEEAIIKALPQVGDSHYKSAASVLSSVGTSRSIPAINIAISKANTENKKYLKAVIDEIKSRQ